MRCKMHPSTVVVVVVVVIVGVERHPHVYINAFTFQIEFIFRAYSTYVHRWRCHTFINVLVYVVVAVFILDL